MIEKDAKIYEDWTSPIQISTSGTIANFPQIVIDERGIYHVVWLGKIGSKKDLNYIFSNQFGNTWSSPQTIKTITGVVSRPDIAIIDKTGKIHLVWADERADGGIFYTSSSDLINWTEPVQVSKTTMSYIFPDTSTDVFVDDNLKIHVVWNDSRSEGDVINYSSSVDNGITWKKTIIISPEGLKSFWFPKVTTSGNRFFISFVSTDKDKNDSLYVASSNESGTVLNSPVLVYFSTRETGIIYNNNSSINGNTINIDPNKKLHLIWSATGKSKKSYFIHQVMIVKHGIRKNYCLNIKPIDWNILT